MSVEQLFIVLILLVIVGGFVTMIIRQHNHKTYHIKMRGHPAFIADRPDSINWDNVETCVEVN